MPGSSISSKYIVILETFAISKKNLDSASARAKVQNRASLISQAITFKPSRWSIALLRKNKEIAPRYAQGGIEHFGQDVVGNWIVLWLRYWVGSTIQQTQILMPFRGGASKG